MITEKAKDNRRGAAIVTCDCPTCSNKLELPCSYEKKTENNWEMDVGRVKRKLTHMGWRISGKKTQCPDHGRGEDR